MAIGYRKKHSEDSNNNIFWTTMADLLLGLAIIFMTLFVLAITGFSQQSIQQKQQQMEVNKELIEKLKEANIDAQVDPLTGDIKIFSKDELVGQIENIVIQGHTDSQSYAGIKNPNEQYLKNMNLSLERANSVANYIFYTNYNKKYNDKLKKILVVEGKSYSEPILVNGKEDYNKSRRVELRLKTKKVDITETIFNGVNNRD